MSFEFDLYMNEINSKMQINNHNKISNKGKKAYHDHNSNRTSKLKEKDEFYL